MVVLSCPHCDVIEVLPEKPLECLEADARRFTEAHGQVVMEWTRE
jgi:hypothetical protein